MNFDFSDDEKMVIQLARDFAEKELRPVARQLDAEGKVAIGAIRKMQEIGLFGLVIPEEYGGAGASTCCYAQVIEELSRVCAALAICLSVHNSVGAYPIHRFGSEEQRRRFLPKLASGGWVGAFCLSEAGSGSDAGSVRTRARRDGDDYILDGSKAWVTNGSIADLYLVLARTSDEGEPHRGISAFLVERTTPGITVGKLEDKMGIRASDTAEINFVGVRVPAANRIGDEGAGFKIAMMALDNGRIGVGAQAVGIAQAAFEEAVKYALERQQFGKPLMDHQAVAFKTADMDTQLAAARLLVRRAADLKDRGEPFGKEAAMAKLYASEMATRVTHQAIQIHGGYGYVKEYPVERYYRDARITEIYEGTSEMQRLVIARQVLGRG